MPLDDIYIYIWCRVIALHLTTSTARICHGFGIVSNKLVEWYASILFLFLFHVRLVVDVLYSWQVNSRMELDVKVDMMQKNDQLDEFNDEMMMILR